MTTVQVSSGGKKPQVGRDHIEITVTNLSDAIMAKNGQLALEPVRTEWTSSCSS
ncbi:MAG: hypothetical protein ABIQ47_13785 [Tepidiformaceae bacterium]